MYPPKYPSTPHWPWSEKVHRDDSYHENPRFFLDKQVVVTEKLDGGNTSLYEGGVYARSTSVPAVHGSFAMVKTYHGWKTTQPEFKGLVFYGEEMYGVHTLEYDHMRREETYRLFAVLDVVRGIFLDWGKVEYYASQRGVKTVPVVYRGSFLRKEDVTEFFQQERAKPSLIGGEKEGFVMRLASAFEADRFPMCVCKYVRANHVQTDEHWLRHWKPCKLCCS